MSNEEFLYYIYQFGINDVVIEKENINGIMETVLTNGEDKVIITNFNFATLLLKSQKFKDDLSLGIIDSNLIIKIVKSYVLALSRYNKQVLEYHVLNNNNQILKNDYLEDLSKNHLHMCQAYSYLNPELKHVCDNLREVINEPQSINDEVLRDAYLKVLKDYEHETGGKTNTLHRNIPNMYEDDPNELGFISIASIVLIIINLGIIIATFIYRH